VDSTGHVKIVDFGNSVPLLHPADDSTWPTTDEEEGEPYNYPHQSILPSGSLNYMAPELLHLRTGGRHTDWWACGVIAYELLTGRSPWSSLTDRVIMCQDICARQPNFSLIEDEEARNFISSLMQKSPVDRLGTNEDTQVAEHPFFEDVDWVQTDNLEGRVAFTFDRVEATTSPSTSSSSSSAFNDMEAQSRNTALNEFYKLMNTTSPGYGGMIGSIQPRNTNNNNNDSRDDDHRDDTIVATTTVAVVANAAGAATTRSSSSSPPTAIHSSQDQIHQEQQQQRDDNDDYDDGDDDERNRQDNLLNDESGLLLAYQHPHLGILSIDAISFILPTMNENEDDDE
jgi:serine/threonine protein kinase